MALAALDGTASKGVPGQWILKKRIRKLFQEETPITLAQKIRMPKTRSPMPAKKLTKSALLQRIAQETDTDRRTAAFFLEVITEIALAEVKKNGEFTLPGIGKLVKQKRKARMGRNPKTGESIKIAAKTVVKFRVAKAVKDSLLGKK